MYAPRRYQNLFIRRTDEECTTRDRALSLFYLVIIPPRLPCSSRIDLPGCLLVHSFRDSRDSRDIALRVILFPKSRRSRRWPTREITRQDRYLLKIGTPFRSRVPKRNETPTFDQIAEKNGQPSNGVGSGGGEREKPNRNGEEDFSENG